MRLCRTSFVLPIALFTASSFATDWANPPVACIENLVPKLYPCLDLTRVLNPLSDVPTDLTEAEIRFWTVDHRADLAFCRAKEVERRETTLPGSQPKGAIEWAWMWKKQVEGIDEKIHAIYETAENVDMPPQILFGALKQESLLSNLGITADGSNFSCGIGQVNLIEWCEYIRTLPEIEQIRMGWPVGTSCGIETLTTEMVRPFYEIALKRLQGRPDYELTPNEFSGIEISEVIGAFPDGDLALQKARFQAATHFVKYCSDIRLGIAAKGNELRRLFDVAVPPVFKKIQTYDEGTRFPSNCQRPYQSKFYPLHTGWLLADAIYNAGERQVSLLQYYYRMKKSSHESGSAWKTMTPLNLIEGLHWGGKWNEAIRKIEYENVYGKKNSQSWFKSCVVQRHIANVIQYVASPGITIAQPLEQGGCSTTKVPEYRKKSPGRIKIR